MWSRHSQRGLLPAGLVVEGAEVGADVVEFAARSPQKEANCPSCGSPSHRVHSKYHRLLSDLPSHGRAIRIRLLVRRFRCMQPACSTRIFAEHLAGDVAPPFSRRTSRLERIVHHLGLSLGGRPAAELAERLTFRSATIRCCRRRSRRGSRIDSACRARDCKWAIVTPAGRARRGRPLCRTLSALSAEHAPASQLAAVHEVAERGTGLGGRANILR
jgi:transposase